MRLGLDFRFQFGVICIIFWCLIFCILLNVLVMFTSFFQLVQCFVNKFHPLCIATHAIISHFITNHFVLCLMHIASIASPSFVFLPLVSLMQFSILIHVIFQVSLFSLISRKIIECKLGPDVKDTDYDDVHRHMHRHMHTRCMPFRQMYAQEALKLRKIYNFFIKNQHIIQTILQQNEVKTSLFPFIFLNQNQNQC